MSRVKRGNVARNRRKKVLKLAKGFRGGLSKLYRPAHQAVIHALSHSFAHRRLKKRDFRALWITRLNAALRQEGISYAVFIGQTKKKDVQLNRKVLSEIAISKHEIFSKIVEFVKK